MKMHALFAVVTAAQLLSSCRAGDWRLGVEKHVHAEEEHYHNHVPTTLVASESLPKEFNWCGASGRHQCVSCWNQHIPKYCGSCWVHGTLSMIQDRLKIRKNGTGTDVMLSRQTLLNCAAYEGMGAGCDGGDVIDVMHYMTKFGLPDESCMPYAASDHTQFDQSLKHCPQAGLCRNCMPLGKKQVETCWAVKTPLLYFLDSYGKVSAADEKASKEHVMMSEIYNRGPITCSIATPDDFTYQYRSGVWVDRSNSTEADIDHDVEVVGWGENEGGKFWVVRNSWGTFWGEVGFFRLQRGVNALFIENGDCWYAEPSYEMEEEDREGKLVGSMYGVLQSNATSACGKAVSVS